MILVVGGTGRLGRELIRRLCATGDSVRVLTRDRSRAQALPDGVEVVVGDLRDSASLSVAVRGCKKVVSAAHGFVGPGSPCPETIDRDGNRALIHASSDAGATHFVLLSVHGASADHPMSLCRAKYDAEEELRASGLPFTIVRATAFMETWLMVIGGTLHAKGHALVFGPGTNPVNFVSVRDVAALVALAVSAASASNETLEIGGPENIGLVTIAQRLVQARGKSAPIKHIPLAALRMLSVLARPFAPAFARQAQAAVLMNTTDMTLKDVTSRARFPSVPLTSFTEVLESATPEND
jgi:uncharacterized protein YbjT (DUF2867 family)